jgi:hypothetical protein
LGNAFGVALLGTVFFDLLGSVPAPAVFDHAMKVTLWIVVGMLLLTFLVAFMLPKQARPDA